MHGFSLENQDQDTESSKSIFADLFLMFVVNSSPKYKRITKEEKDPKGQYAINTCSTKLLSKQTKFVHVLKLHRPL